MNIILYHAHCPDGFGAAFAAWLKFGDAARYIPVSYGKPIPVEGTSLSPTRTPGDKDVPSTIYILDFSYPADVLEELAGRADVQKVVVLDHHKTAAEALYGLPDPAMPEKLTARFDMEKSGAVLAWEYFHPDEPIPPVLLYLQDRDLWKWELEWSREINAGLWRATERTFEHWDICTRWMSIAPTLDPEDCMAHEFRERGGAILQSDRLMLDTLAAGAGHQHTTGGLCRVVNSPVLQSELGDKLLADDPMCEYVDIWWETATGRHHSLRSRKGGVDVSAIAAHRGGGGHQSAAGWREQP